MMLKYDLIVSSSSNELAYDVNQRLKAGWELHGVFIVINETTFSKQWCQAMTKEDKVPSQVFSHNLK